MISLKRAMLCVNCEFISDAYSPETGPDCAACGSKQLIALAQMVGGSLLAGNTEVSVAKAKSEGAAPCDKAGQLTPELRAAAEKAQAALLLRRKALQAQPEESCVLQDIASWLQRQIAHAELQPFLFRAEITNYDYLCKLAARDRLRSLNTSLNLILHLLRTNGVYSLSELLRILQKEKGKENV
ncbi:MAG TPA: hypothetical protein VK699_18460 [Terriglobales bacterium]|jgi:hypothetical protein|nr:hypothetical protein [Terriglobales bacterium]